MTELRQSSRALGSDEPQATTRVAASEIGKTSQETRVSRTVDVRHPVWKSSAGRVEGSTGERGRQGSWPRIIIFIIINIINNNEGGG